MATVWEERVEMRDPSRKEDAKNLGIVYGTGAVAALLTAALGYFEPWTNLRGRLEYGPGTRKANE